MTNWPDIIVLNGSSSAGKTTIAKAMQNTFELPYLIFGFDDFVMRSPKRYWGNSDSPEQTDDFAELEQGVQMIAREDDPKAIDAVFGPVFKQIIHAMPAAIAALAASGCPVIFDHVYHDQTMVDRAQACFEGFDVFHIGVHCPLLELERREAARGDRVVGRARGLFDVVHSLQLKYDLEVDTTEMDAEHVTQLALKIFESRSL